MSASSVVSSETTADPSLRVSVVIPAFNAARFVADAIESVLAQTQPPLEILVVDDGSSDATRQVIESYAGRITPVIHPENRGLSAARNSGISLARGELIGLLDSDDAWDPRMIEAQRREFRENPGIGLCFTDLWDCDPELKSTSHRRGYRRRSGENCFAELYLTAFPIPPSTLFLRREVFERAGAFDPSMRQVEDFEFSLRATMLFTLSCIPEPLCLRRLHSGSISQTGATEFRLNLESRAFDLCAAAARRAGIELPIPVEERKAVSKRRRLGEMLAYNDLTAAEVYCNALAADNRLTGADRMHFETQKLRIRLRNFVRAAIGKGPATVG